FVWGGDCTGPKKIFFAQEKIFPGNFRLGLPNFPSLLYSLHLIADLFVTPNFHETKTRDRSSLYGTLFMVSSGQFNKLG
ncbi:MAG: hypothetical protein ACYCRE_12710, partial [Acidobacteriaceae bacterium]